jgi:predicted PurR-regulated permease PerM
MAFGGEATLTRDQSSGSPTTENEASGMGGPARKARPAPHPYVQVAVLVLAAVVAWELAGVLLLLFSAILLAAALSAMSDGLRRLAPLPSQVTVLLAALLMFGVLASVIALFGWRILAQYEEILSKARDSAHALLAYDFNRDPTFAWIAGENIK